MNDPVTSNKYGTFKPSKQIIKFHQKMSARCNNRDILKSVKQHLKNLKGGVRKTYNTYFKREYLDSSLYAFIH